MLRRSIVGLSLALLATAAAVPAVAQQQWKMGSLMQPPTYGATQLRYQARAATTDRTAQASFRRYWRLIRPGVAIVMHRALRRIKAEAERRAASQLAEVGS